MWWRRSKKEPTDWDALERTRAVTIGTSDLEQPIQKIVEQVSPFTLTSPERIAALCASVDYVVRHGVEGAIAECGVWRGGSMMAVALRLLDLGVTDRDLIGFDTFAGMSRPTSVDIDWEGRSWADWQPSGVADEGASFEEVTDALRITHYPSDRVRFVVGDVGDTLPRHTPEQLAILRLDTDWYESTKHELLHLYPRLAVGGILIIDDYGHYAGAQKAVDEYFQSSRIFLHRIDYTGRIAVKQA
jgi:O-methyltransferase